MNEHLETSEFLNYCKMTAARELSWGASGNLSLRLGDDSFLITASGSHFAFMDDSEVARCSLSDCSSMSGAKPSVEAALHRAIYESSDAKCVLHVHPFYSVLSASAVDFALDLDVIPEAGHYLGNVAVIPFESAGSNELAKKAGEAVSKGADFLVLRNHGVVCLGSDFKRILAAVEAYEFIAKLNYFAKAGNVQLEKGLK